jgi:hypothetical protein
MDFQRCQPPNTSRFIPRKRMYEISPWNKNVMIALFVRGELININTARKNPVLMECWVEV